MDGTAGVNSLGNGWFSGTSGLTRSIPEPKSRVGNWFNVLAKNIGALVGNRLEGVEGTQYADLISEQLRVQQEMMLVSMQSNLLRTEHETEMSVVRNLRAA